MWSFVKSSICQKGRALGAGLVVVLLVVAASGCGDSKVQNKKGADPDAGTPESDTNVDGPDEALLGFSTASAEALCGKLYDCCTADQIKEELGIDATNAEQCTNQAAAFSFIFGYSQIDDSIKAGRIRLDESMTALCIESIEETACSDIKSGVDLQKTAAGCREIFQAQVSIGGACEIDDDCREGYCSLGEASEAGTCQPLPGLNEECPDLTCAEGFYCETADFICEEARDDGQSCFGDQECQSGYCATDDQGDQRCAPPEAICGN